MIDGDDRTALKEEANMMIDVAQFLWCWGKTFVVGLFCVSVWSLFHALFDLINRSFVSLTFKSGNWQKTSLIRNCGISWGL